ncbi:hypothetical protein IT774_04900 [Salinimonas marina]|uniref:Toxin CptA n=1 Tax=Salinimonas marina TaxID=2785918 RepID=A0A7S9DZH4_9ALTE|nr:protein YgfX [Salinimonas marina]QPG06513.1 hypothetical protein IT774_04900 [Salinimonas marina]
MLKYKFTLRSHPLRRWQWVVPLVAVGVVGVCLPEPVYSYASYPLVLAIVAGLAIYALYGYHHCAVRPPWLVGFDGASRWQQASVPASLAEAPIWWLTRRSRITPLGLYLHFSCNQQPCGYHWIWRSECDELHYRRLSRAILHLQRATAPTL